MSSVPNIKTNSWITSYLHPGSLMFVTTVTPKICQGVVITNGRAHDNEWQIEYCSPVHGTVELETKVVFETPKVGAVVLIGGVRLLVTNVKEDGSFYTRPVGSTIHSFQPNTKWEYASGVGRVNE